MRYFSLKAIYLKRLSVRLADNFEQINPRLSFLIHYRNITFAGSTDIKKHQAALGELFSGRDKTKYSKKSCFSRLYGTRQFAYIIKHVLVIASFKPSDTLFSNVLTCLFLSYLCTPHEPREENQYQHHWSHKLNIYIERQNFILQHSV